MMGKLGPLSSTALFLVLVTLTLTLTSTSVSAAQHPKTVISEPDNSIEPSFLSDEGASVARGDRDDGETGAAPEAQSDAAAPATSDAVAADPAPAPAAVPAAAAATAVQEKVPPGSIGEDVVPPEMVMVQDGVESKNFTVNPADEEYLPGGPSTFTVTSSEVGFPWDKLPWRERYQWSKVKAPCHTFKLQVPDERTQFSTISLCIYRPHLEYPDDTDHFIRREEEVSEIIGEMREQKVYGHVKGQAGSHVYGKIVGTSFYGEVSVYDTEAKEDVVYVVEEIKLLKKLMRQNEKILRNILSVMSKGNTGAKYNAVVTRGASLMNFMSSVNPSEFVRGSFLVFSTSRNSYITAGEPQMEVDDDGVITFNAGGDKIVIDNEGHSAVHLITGNDREYVFRPNGKTVVQDGNDVIVLEEHEGAVAVSAFTADNSYGCILPTPAFQPQRNGGYLCKVCLAVDRSFLEYYMENVTPPTKTVSFLGRILDNVSWIFRATDWNADGTPDNVGLEYDRQFDNWAYLDAGNETLEYEDLDVLYGDLARKDFTDCCVAVTYTMKRFPGPHFAKSAAGSDKRLNVHNGICGGQSQAGLANNLILISANSKRGNYSMMSEEQLTFLTAQQLGRAFGSGPDGTGDDACDEFRDAEGRERHYLMWPDALRNTSTEEKVLSRCSRVTIAKTLAQCKSACFDIDKHPFCGNGIVEEGEECDCGAEAVCEKQKCCYSRHGLHPCRKSGIGCKKSGVSRVSVSTSVMFPVILMGLRLICG